MSLKSTRLLAACLSLVVIACGPSELAEEEDTSGSMEQVSQEAGSAPSCPSLYMQYEGTSQSKTDVLSACGGCTTRIGAKPGIRSASYQRCCTYYYATETTTCGAWKLIEDRCDACVLSPD